MEIIEIAKSKLAERTALGPNGCVEWTGCRNGDGYGNTSIKGRVFRMHRLSWIINHGEIPKGMCVMHLCDNPPCVNPSHLRLGTHRENMQDRDRKRRGHMSRLTSCPNGHKYTPENTIITSRNGRRACRQCRKNANKKRVASGYYDDYYKKNRAKKLARAKLRYQWKRGGG